MRTERYGYPILTAEQIRAMDSAAEPDYGLPLAVLMENAGRAVADVAMSFPGERVYIAVGSGNNGGDALVAARLLHERGRKVIAWMMKPADQLSGLAALSARRYEDAGGCTAPVGTLDWVNADLIIDGLLGTGITGEVREPVASVISAINEAGRPVLSIDVPSGVASDASGEPSVAIRATRTVTLACYKPAVVHYPAASWAGDVVLADIGFPNTLYPVPDAVVLSTGFVREILPTWPQETYKGKRGTLLVVAGSRGMAGAATMASESATHAGAGLVYLACPDTLTAVYETKLTDQIVRPAPDGGAAHFTPQSLDAVLSEMGKADAVILGPGLSHVDDVADFVAAFLPKVDKPILIDADGLNILAARQLKPPADAVLTPHPGEMSRLLGISIPDVQKDRVATAKRAAEEFGCAVVLKGAHTVIAAPGQPAVVNMVSHPVLATAGSGDVLSGVIGALLSQKVSPFDAAIAGVRWHGTAGAVSASKSGGTLGASDILQFLPRAREVILGNHETEVLV